jgi:hypothetical protein
VVSHILATVVLNLEELIHFFQRQARGLNVEQPADGTEGEIRNGEHEVEFPSDAVDGYLTLVTTKKGVEGVYL